MGDAMSRICKIHVFFIKKPWNASHTENLMLKKRGHSLGNRNNSEKRGSLGNRKYIKTGHLVQIKEGVVGY